MIFFIIFLAVFFFGGAIYLIYKACTIGDTRVGVRRVHPSRGCS